jgi:hypothetical protein
MACCRQRRQQISRTTPVEPISNPTPPSTVSRVPPNPRITAFQHIGKTALTTVGPVSGRYYRFSYPGAIVERIRPPGSRLKGPLPESRHC